MSARSALTPSSTPRRTSLMWTAPIALAPVARAPPPDPRRPRAGGRSRAAASRRCPRGSARSPARPRRRSTCGGGRPARSRARGRRRRRARRCRRACASGASSRRSSGSSPPRPGVGDPLGAAGVAQHGPRAGRAGGVEQVERVVQRRRVLLEPSASENRMGTKPPTTSRPLALEPLGAARRPRRGSRAGRGRCRRSRRRAIASSTAIGSGTAKSVPTVISKAP